VNVTSSYLNTTTTWTSPSSSTPFLPRYLDSVKAAMARFNLPPLTRSLLASLIVFTLLNIILRPQDNLVEKLEKPIMTTGDGVPYLTIVPGQSIMYPWVFLVATAVEANLMGLIITGLTIFYGGRYLERAWGSKEFTKFILFVAMIPNLLSFFLYLLGYMLSGNVATL
jgi:membrane associated rhomboid family serine protease